MENPNPKASIEYNDNLLSLYSAQKGKCRICRQKLEISDIYCHHIKPNELGGTDEYKNLIIIHTKIHNLIHSTDIDEISKTITEFNLDTLQLEKVNKFRNILNLEIM